MHKIFYCYLSVVLIAVPLHGMQERGQSSSRSNPGDSPIHDVTTRVCGFAEYSYPWIFGEYRLDNDRPLVGGSIGLRGTWLDVNTQSNESDIEYHGYIFPNSGELTSVSAIAKNRFFTKAFGYNNGEIYIDQTSKYSHYKIGDRDWITPKIKAPILSLALDDSGFNVAYAQKRQDMYRITVKPCSFFARLIYRDAEDVCELASDHFTQCAIALNNNASKLVVLRTILQCAQLDDYDHKFDVYRKTGERLEHIYTFKMENQGRLSMLPTWKRINWAFWRSADESEKRRLVPIAVALRNGKLSIGYEGLDLTKAQRLTRSFGVVDVHEALLDSTGHTEEQRSFLDRTTGDISICNNPQEQTVLHSFSPNIARVLEFLAFRRSYLGNSRFSPLPCNPFWTIQAFHEDDVKEQ